MAFFKLPTKVGAKKDATPAAQAPRAIPRGRPYAYSLSAITSPMTHPAESKRLLQRHMLGW